MSSISLIQKEISINNFKKVKRISKIGCGFTYIVEKKTTSDLFVAKTLDCNDDEEQCNTIIKHDINKIIAMNHPTIVKFIGYSQFDFQGDNNITILMEYAINGSLTNILQKIRENNIPPNYTNTTRQIILVGICDGMKYLHEHKIIHNSLHPNNILLDCNLYPFITDFRVSDQINSQILPKEKLPYIAPEILNKSKYDEKVDVYSFGIIMYEIITDSQSFPLYSNGEISDQEFKTKIVTENYQPSFDKPIKSTYRQLIKQCLSRNSNERPSFEEIFNKLTNKENLKTEENFLLDKVYQKKLHYYIEEISRKQFDFGENILNRIGKIESENGQLKSEIAILKNENDHQLEEISKIEQYCQQMEKENDQLEKENHQQEEEINLIENYFQQIDDEIKRIQNENKEKRKRIELINHENQQIMEQIRMIKNK